MSSGPSTIIEPGGFVLVNNTITAPQFVTLYTLAGIYAERIESVYMQLLYGSDVIAGDVYAVQLLAPDGAILFEQPTPPLTVTGPTDFVAILGWSRQGNDSAQETFPIQEDGGDENSYWAWANMRLPDLTLPPLSSVVLVSRRTSQSLNAAVQVQRATITTTRNDGAVATTTSVGDILPLLQPTTG